MSEAQKEQAEGLIDDIFGDTSVDPATTADHLVDIADKIEECLVCLREDGETVHRVNVHRGL